MKSARSQRTDAHDPSRICGRPASPLRSPSFATISALLGPREMSDLSPQSGPKRTLTRLLSPIAILWVHAVARHARRSGSAFGRSAGKDPINGSERVLINRPAISAFMQTDIESTSPNDESDPKGDEGISIGRQRAWSQPTADAGLKVEIDVAEIALEGSHLW